MASHSEFDNDESSEDFDDDEEEEESPPGEHRTSKFLAAGMRALGGENESRSTPRRDSEWNRTVWRQFYHQKSPNIFGTISIADDGGFSEVDKLWYPMRWFTAGLSILFIISNVYFLITVNFRLLSGQPASGDTADAHQTRTMFLLTEPASRLIFRNAEHGDDLIAVFELSGLTVLIAEGCHQLCRAKGAKAERLRWFAIERFFWQIVPQLSSYSAMRLLHNVSPTVFMATISVLIADLKQYDRWDSFKVWVKFVLFHLFCLVVGFDSFLVKIRAAYSSINERDLNLENLYGAAVFMMQVLGVVRLGTFVQKRLFIFIFAGEDGVMQPHEKAKQNVWNALLVRRIYHEHPFFRFIAIVMSFDDTDFQGLVLNEHPPEPVPDHDVESGTLRKRLPQ